MPRDASRRAGWVVWVAAVLFVPLPYLQLADGAVPVARFTMLAGVAGLYGLTVDPGGVVWMVAGILALHALGYALLLAVLASLLVRVFPPQWALGAGAAMLLLGVLLAILLPIYHTPFDEVAARTAWLGLWQ